jgi:hypothetical protein
MKMGYEFNMDEFKNLKSVKNDYDDWEAGYGLYKSQIDWLIEQAEKAERYENALKEILRCNQPVIQDFEGYSIAKEALE